MYGLLGAEKEKEGEGENEDKEEERNDEQCSSPEFGEK